MRPLCKRKSRRDGAIVVGKLRIDVPTRLQGGRPAQLVALARYVADRSGPLHRVLDTARSGLLGRNHQRLRQGGCWRGNRRFGAGCGCCRRLAGTAQVKRKFLLGRRQAALVVTGHELEVALNRLFHIADLDALHKAYLTAELDDVHPEHLVEAFFALALFLGVAQQREVAAALKVD